MNPKRIIMAGTMAIAITISAGMYGNDASAGTLSVSIDKSGAQNKTRPTGPPQTVLKETAKPDITQVLGLASDADLYDALYNGSSLADLAGDKQIDVQEVIDLQVAELTGQLDARLADGSISLITYLLQKAELPEIVTKSVHTRMAR